MSMHTTDSVKEHFDVASFQPQNVVKHIGIDIGMVKRTFQTKWHAKQFLQGGMRIDT